MGKGFSRADFGDRLPFRIAQVKISHFCKEFPQGVSRRGQTYTACCLNRHASGLFVANALKIEVSVRWVLLGNIRHDGNPGAGSWQALLDRRQLGREDLSNFDFTEAYFSHDR